MVVDVYERNVTPLALVFKDRSSWGWAFVSLVGVLFIPLIAPSLLALMRYAPYDSLYNICRGEGIPIVGISRRGLVSSRCRLGGMWLPDYSGL